MNKRVLILGAGLMQKPAITAARGMGWYVAAADGNPRAAAAFCADCFEPIDLKDIPALESFARRIKDSGGLDGVFTAGTDFSAAAALLAQRFSLPGHSYEAACNATDKTRMRCCFADAGVPSPRYIALDVPLLEKLEAAAEGAPRDICLPDSRFSGLISASFDFPLVVKPVDNMGARGCRRADSFAEFIKAAKIAVSFSQSGRVIAEEYMEGPEFSIDALVFDGKLVICGFADRHIYYPPYFIEMGHTMPSDLAEDKIATIISVFTAGVRALGLTEGAAKGDMRLTSKGPMIGEIAARLSGGYMSGWTYPYSSGGPLTREALRICAGERPESLEPAVAGLTPSYYIESDMITGKQTIRGCTVRCSAERAWISVPGIVASVTGLEEASQISGVADVFVRAEAGSSVVFPQNNVEKCGNVIAVCDTRAKAVQAASDAVRGICLRLETGREETRRFLDSRADFPPAAFILDKETETHLYGLPDFLYTVRMPLSAAVPAISPLPDFLLPYLDTIRDWNGRTLRDTLALFEKFFGVSLISACISEERPAVCGFFWRRIIRGGIQGALYTADTLMQG